MTNKQQAHTIAAVGTALFLLLLFLLLWFVYVGAPVQEEDEGIEIAFGEMTETQSYASAAEATELVAPQAVTAPSEPAVPTHNDLMTQEDEESLELARQREEEERLRREAEAERLRQEQAAAEQRAREERLPKPTKWARSSGNKPEAQQERGMCKAVRKKAIPYRGMGQ